MLDEIFERISEKGWSVYETIWGTESWRSSVRRGPKDGLCSSVQYYVFPTVSDPMNPEEVTRKAIDLAETGIEPSIKYRGVRIPLSFITVGKNIIKVGIPDYGGIGYEDFYISLNSLPSIRKPPDA